MSDKIKVGDRVHPDRYGDNVTQRVAAVEGDEAWLVNSKGDHLTHRLSNLTRIEPEPVTLTAKYGVGEKVRIKSIAGCAGESVVSRPSLFYDLGWRGWWREDKLEPIPTPCPTCKGSGVSEGGA